MDLTKNDAAVCPDSIDAQASTKSAGEIDLYDELITFAELSPEEQSRVVDRPKKAPAQPEEESATQSEEQAIPEPVLSRLPVEPDAAVQEAETPIELVTEQQISAEENQPNVSVEAIQSEFAIGESSLPSTVAADRPFELVLTEKLIETTEPQVVPSTPVAFADLAEERTATELVATHSPLESVDAVATAPAEEPGRVSEILKPTVETDIRIPPSAAPRPSGPLSGFNLPPEIVYTGALSRGVCLACGAESGADDLFCLTCGVFIDEIASSLPSSPTCGECKQRIEADEIFCPWCGSSETE